MGDFYSCLFNPLIMSTLTSGNVFYNLDLSNTSYFVVEVAPGLAIEYSLSWPLASL
jgi:hypothetical protein